VAVARAKIPYRSQYASPELIAEVAAGRRAAADDPRWRDAGASSREEYARWARCGCGMACLQMILAARGDPVPPLVELGWRCTGHGGYEERPARGYGPLIYAGFVSFVTAELGLDARVAAPLALDELVAAVRGDEVVLASVSVEIRELAPSPARRGGHLVLVYDVDDDGRLRFHDPSGDRPQTAQGVWLAAAEFERFFSGRGIAVTLPRD
jgi:hypothetical protein